MGVGAAISAVEAARNLKVLRPSYFVKKTAKQVRLALQAM